MVLFFRYGTQYRTAVAMPSTVVGAAAPAMWGVGGAYPVGGALPAINGWGAGNLPVGGSMPAVLTRLYGAGAGAGAAGAGASKK